MNAFMTCLYLELFTVFVHFAHLYRHSCAPLYLRQLCLKWTCDKNDIVHKKNVWMNSRPTFQSNDALLLLFWSQHQWCGLASLNKIAFSFAANAPKFHWKIIKPLHGPINLFQDFSTENALLNVTEFHSSIDQTHFIDGFYF